MRIIALSTLKVFWEVDPGYQDAKEPTLAWYRHTLHADWGLPAEVKQDFKNAGILKESLPHEQSECFGYGRVVFNIAGNKYRLVVWINYAYRVVYVRFIGTHSQYDRVDAQTI